MPDVNAATLCWPGAAGILIYAARLSNTLFTTGTAEKALGQPVQ